MPSLIGNKPNQVPTNGDLGTAAFQDAERFYASANNVVFRNKIINGNFLIHQRGNVTVTALPQFGLDRWYTSISSGTSVSGTITKAAFTGASSGVGLWISSTSFTAGQPYFFQRIEAANSVDLNGKLVTVSGRLYQDTGSNVNFTVRLSRANAVDNFSTTTVVSTSGDIQVPSGSHTPFSVSFPVGASDATNGLMLEIFTSSALTVSSKNFAIADIQLEAGPVATPFESRPVGVELALCQRYYQTGTVIVPPSTIPAWNYFLKVTMRAAPQIAGGGAGFTSSFITPETFAMSQTTSAQQTLTMTAEL